MRSSRGPQGASLSTNRPKSPRRTDAAATAPSLLVLAKPCAETDDLLETLVKRSDLVLLRVTDINGAEIALRDLAVSLVLVCPETEAAAVTAILDRPISFARAPRCSPCARGATTRCRPGRDG